MRHLLIIILVSIFSKCYGQINIYQCLLDTALSNSGALFIHSNPLKVNRLSHKDMNQYVEYIKEVENLNLDTAKFSQIIRNAEVADTTIWEENEFPSALLVTRRDEVISKKYALKKLEIIEAKEIRFYKKQIRKFNAAEINDRNLYYFSRPVFDNSKSLAIIQWDNGHSYLGGGGGIILFQLQSGKTWKKIGNILDWRY